MKKQKASDNVSKKQKKFYFLGIGILILAGAAIVFLLNRDEGPVLEKISFPKRFDSVSKEVKAEDIRLSNLENFNDILGDRLHSLEKVVLNLKEDKMSLEQEKKELSYQTLSLQTRINSLEEELLTKVAAPSRIDEDVRQEEWQEYEPPLKIWEASDRKEEKNVLFEIPAGTVVKAVLVSGADCSVAIQKPTGPNMILLRPLDNGKLPRNVRVPLKGSIIIGNAIGDISSERVYVRAERMTLVERGGDFVETEVSAYVSGEDGREGLRGVVVDRSGQIISRVAFAAVLQGIGQTIQGTLNNQTIEKLAQTGSDKTILNVDMLRNSAFQGGSTALNKLSEYYVKKSEQLQPAIQIAAGRVVDVIFTKTVKIGEKDLKKKLDREREEKMRGVKNG